MTFDQWIETQPVYLFWLLGGLLALGLSAIAFEPTLAALGIAAVITAIAALSIVDPIIQLLIWAILSVTLALVLRSLVPSGEASGLAEPIEAEVCKAIPRGGKGEVLYEGSYWSAQCQISDVAIAPNQRVYVVGRQGNTLIVMPQQSWSPEPQDRSRS